MAPKRRARPIAWLVRFLTASLIRVVFIHLGSIMGARLPCSLPGSLPLGSAQRSHPLSRGDTKLLKAVSFGRFPTQDASPTDWVRQLLPFRSVYLQGLTAS